MGLMDGKTAVIFGVANERSIAWGITKAFPGIAQPDLGALRVKSLGDAPRDRALVCHAKNHCGLAVHNSHIYLLGLNSIMGYNPAGSYWSRFTG